jgi:hypothetical protein
MLTMKLYHRARGMSTFKLRKICLGFDADFVELGGEGVERAERGDVEYEAVTPPQLPLKWAFRWD